MESIQQQLEAGSPKKRKPHEPRQSRIEVRVKSAPSKYVPGTGPALQRISLLPPKDSTAYILERIILPSPGLAADGFPLPRRMTYIVAWHDLPAAQMLVPAMDILEYVSPRELEEWEFANTEEQMEEEVVQKQQNQAGEVPKPRKRGRPPKHSKIETAVVAVADDGDTVVPRGAMTIATPTKNRLKDFEGLSDEDATPAGQLQWETTGESIGADDQGLNDQELDIQSASDGFGSTRAGAQTEALRDPGFKYQATKQSYVPAKDFESFPSTATSSRQSTPKVTAIKSKSEGKKKACHFRKEATLNGRLNGLKAAESASESVWSPQGSVIYSNSGVETPDPEPKTMTARLVEESVSVQNKTKKKSKSGSRTPKPSKPPPQQHPAGSMEDSEEPDPLDDAEDQGDPGWEVKRLEGMEVYDVEGMGQVRYFKVRWEGDWPPDQNPTWEPEGNLPENLVRNYMKNRKRKRPAGEKRSSGEKPKRPATTQSAVAPSYAPKKKSMKQTTLSWGLPAKQYKSVAEAFEGGDEDELDLPQQYEAPIEEEEQDDELFIVEEPPTKKSRMRTW
ncbi:hypothetical protein ACLX1H_010831 [Fusarium chlamydosporum]